MDKNMKTVQTIETVQTGFLPLVFLTLALLIFSADWAYAIPTHLDGSKVTGGCSACHKGHGMPGTELLESRQGSLCFNCHGPGGKARDIYSVIMKPSNHPVIQTARYHVDGEQLPERDPSAPRHVSCYDCHNVHMSEEGDAISGVRGYSGRGVALRQADREYELCYRCHSDSANLSQQKNVANDFSPDNASFHPVETYGKNSFVPSLKRGYDVTNLITCSDCHGNDDPSGPKGPHGSIYPPILNARYEMTPGPESPARYALCYQCHNRTSILNDESFKAHKEHVVFNQTPCSSCHDAHGSRTYPDLIKFDISVVSPNSRGELNIMVSVPGRPRCLLSCHINNRTADHRLGSPNGSAPPGSQLMQYCVNSRCMPEW